MNNLTINGNTAQTMSSREIAELCDKRHDNVMTDIRGMLLELNLATPEFSGVYIADNKQQYECFNLPRRECDILVSGYSIKYRAAIVDRWQELESRQAIKIPSSFAEELQLAADQAKQLELAAPKVAFVDDLVERKTLMTATQIAQKHGISAIKLNRYLDERGGVYSKVVKRGRVFIQSFIDKGYGEVKQTELGHSQCLFLPAGEVWIHSIMISDGIV